MKISTLFLIILLITFIQSKTTYKNNKVVAVQINSAEEFQKFSKAIERKNLDMWSEEYGKNTEMIIRFTKEQLSKLNTMKSPIKFSKFQVGIPDLAVLLEKEQKQMKEHKMQILQKQKLLKTQEGKKNLEFSDSEWFKSYHTYDENLEYFQNLMAQYPRNIDKEVLAQSHEGRDVFILRLHSAGAYDASKPSLFLQSLQHAREWVGLPCTQYFISNLLKSKLLEKINVHYIPILNPDGFSWTHSNARMWRKNRRVNGLGSYGVDLNRNWASGFGGPGSSGLPFTDTYRGPSAFSEPETKAVDEYLKKYQNQVKATMDYHAFSQLNLRAWGRSRDVPRDDEFSKRLGAEMMSALKNVHGIDYRNIRAVELYQASGMAGDEWYDNGFISYTYELRPSSMFGGGFALPANQILPCAEEANAGTLVLANYIARTTEKNGFFLGKILNDFI